MTGRYSRLAASRGRRARDRASNRAGREALRCQRRARSSRASTSALMSFFACSRDEGHAIAHQA
jgi:hypothetical protein